MFIFNPTLLPIVVNLYTKFEISVLNGCGDIFDKKSGEKEKGTNTRKPICNPTIQLVIANLYTKFEVSILNVVEISLTKILERQKKEQI